jgi:dihydroxyacetone kinase-like predicted kinase
MVKEHKSFVEFKFDTQLLIDIADKDVDDAEDELRDFILTELKGDSLVLASVEGEDKYGNPENFIKVHFHTNEPWLVLAKGQEMGDIYDVVVENMQRQADGLKG